MNGYHAEQCDSCMTTLEQFYCNDYEYKNSGEEKRRADDHLHCWACVRCDSSCPCPCPQSVRHSVSTGRLCTVSHRQSGAGPGAGCRVWSPPSSSSVRYVTVRECMSECVYVLSQYYGNSDDMNAT